MCSIAQLSINYLYNFLQLYQAPAFASYYGSIQYAFLTFTTISENMQLASYYVDEVIHHCISGHQPSDNDGPKEDPDNLRLKAKQDMRFSGKKVPMNLHKKFDLPPENDSRPPGPFDHFIPPFCLYGVYLLI